MIKDWYLFLKSKSSEMQTCQQSVQVTKSLPFDFVEQEEIGFKIDAVEAVAMKLLQRLNYSASVMKTSAIQLQEGACPCSSVSHVSCRPSLRPLTNCKRLLLLLLLLL